MALVRAHALDQRLLYARIERLEAVLRYHGIPSPSEDSALTASSAEHLEACKRVVRAAYELLPHLEELRATVGSGMELLEEESWYVGNGNGA